MNPTPSRAPFTPVPNPPAPPTPAPPTGIMAEQPLVTIGTVTTIVSWALGAFVTWGIDLTDAKRDTILTGIGILWPMVTIFWGWHKVYSFHSTQKVINQAAVAGRFGEAPPKV